MKLVFYAPLAEGDAAVERVRRRSRRRSRQQEMMHASPPPPGRVHARVSDCHGGAISQSGDSRPALIFTILERPGSPLRGNKPGLGVRVCACEGIDNKKKRKEKIATEKKKIDITRKTLQNRKKGSVSTRRRVEEEEEEVWGQGGGGGQLPLQAREGWK